MQRGKKILAWITVLPSTKKETDTEENKEGITLFLWYSIKLLEPPY